MLGQPEVEHAGLGQQRRGENRVTEHAGAVLVQDKALERKTSVLATAGRQDKKSRAPFPWQGEGLAGHSGEKVGISPGCSVSAQPDRTSPSRAQHGQKTFGI